MGSLFQSEARRHCLNYPPLPSHPLNAPQPSDTPIPPSQQEEGGGEDTINGKRLGERERDYLLGPSSGDRHSTVLRDKHVHQLGEAEQSN